MKNDTVNKGDSYLELFTELLGGFSSAFETSKTAFIYKDEIKKEGESWVVNIFLPGRNIENTQVLADNRKSSSFDLKINDKSTLEQIKSFKVSIPAFLFDYNSFSTEFKDGILKIRLAEQKQTELSIIELI